MNNDWLTVKVVHQDRVEMILKDQKKRKNKRKNPVEAGMRIINNILG